ncbi:unnamed protein product [Rhizophagus irregularis]|nr:unnamed protein product [Rhizophagus irregularis]
MIAQKCHLFVFFPRNKLEELCDDECVSIKFICVILTRSRSSIIDKWPVMYREEPCEILAELEVSFKGRVILLSLISELSEATPISTTDNEDLESSSSLI